MQNIPKSDSRQVREKLASRSEYILRISAGPDLQHLTLLEPNAEDRPIFVNSPHFSGYLLLRYLDFQGVSKGMEDEDGNGRNGAKHNPIPFPKSTYFKGRKRRYSMVAQGRFKGEFNGDDILFGVDSDQGLPNVPGFGMLIRVSKWLDPALEAGSGNNPHCYTPLISAMNQLAVYPAHPKTDMSKDGRSLLEDNGSYAPPSPSSFDSQSGNDSIKTVSIGTSSPLDCGDWSFASTDIPEKTELMFSNPDDAEYATTYEKRKKLFGKPEKRKDVSITSDNIYCMDFYDGYFCHNSFHLKLPGISINAFNYHNGEQKIRYVCKTRDGSKVFFAFQFELVPRAEYFNE